MADKKIILTNTDVLGLAYKVSHALSKYANTIGAVTGLRAFAIPRGGIPAAYAITANQGCPITLVEDPNDADVFLDDIVDSGDTMQKWCDEYPDKPFFALIDKTDSEQAKQFPGWIVFPWEQKHGADGKQDDLQETMRRLVQHLDDSPDRGGLEETPKRAAKAWQFWTKGYGQNPEDILKVFEDGAEGSDEMVVVKDIPLYSHCEHHMAPIFGTATIAYIPNGKIVGLSKLSRLLDIFARRLQVQERLTNQVADALQKHLAPLGVGVVIKARHMCMESRGVCQQGHYTITSALRGVMKDQAETRAEFMMLAK